MTLDAANSGDGDLATAGRILPLIPLFIPGADIEALFVLIGEGRADNEMGLFDSKDLKR